MSIISSDANIFDKKILKIGKMTPFAIAQRAPKINTGILSFPYAKSLLKMCLSYFFVN